MNMPNNINGSQNDNGNTISNKGMEQYTTSEQ